MKPAGIILLWITVIVTGAFLRFDQLEKRPFHADEATGARIVSRRIDANGGQFDPKHFHGPLLGDLAIPLCRLHGENRWRDMKKSTLRTLPAIAGTLLICLPLLWRRRCGDAPMLLAAAFLATSPLLVYYSRMFIHESLLVLFGMLALVTLTRKPRWGIPGFLVALMFATKESFAISLIAWSGAAIMIALTNRKSLSPGQWPGYWRQYRIPLAASLLAATVTSLWFYTSGFRHPQGAIDAIRTFFVYETVAGHDKPFAYYFQFLVIPKKAGGVWWFETPVLIAALLAVALTFRRHPGAEKSRNTIQFIAWSALGHFAIYSLIAYKTPWLACLPWAHVCLLAGFSANGLSGLRLPTKLMGSLLVVAVLVSQFKQSRLATGRYASDERNPYAYVPTRGDIEKLIPWLEQLSNAAPGGSLEPVAVVGVDYWPLPWYLRSFEPIGYWPDPPPNLKNVPLVFAMPESTAAVMEALAESHEPLPRGLRSGVPVYLFVRNDVWKRWMETNAK